MTIEHLTYLLGQRQFNRLQEVLMHFQFAQEPPDSFWHLVSKHLLRKQDQLIVKIMSLYLVFKKANSPLQSHFLQLFNQLQLIEQNKQEEEFLAPWFQFLTEHALQKIPMGYWTATILLQLCALLQDSTTSQDIGVEFFEKCLAQEKQWLQKQIVQSELVSAWCSLLFQHYYVKQVNRICTLLLSQFNASSEHLIKTFFVTFKKMVRNSILLLFTE